MADWNLSWHHSALGIPELWTQGITGRGVTVALLDSGLANPVGLDRGDFEYLDAGGAQSRPLDSTGHGTCCGSVIASYRGGALGIAPDAKLVSFRVLNTDTPALDVEAALTYLLQNRPDVDVVSCSFTVAVASDRLALAVRGLVNAGKVVIAAAGDVDGAREDFPELTPNAVTVAAVDQSWRPLAGATVGPWIDLAAPGQGIPAVAPGINQVVQLGESSAAAAVVSGVAALALSTRAPGADRARLALGLEGLLRATATSIPNADPGAVGAGLVNPAALLKAAQAI